MSIKSIHDIPTIRHRKTQVFQAKTSQGLVCVIAADISEAANKLVAKGHDVGFLQSVGELVE